MCVFLSMLPVQSGSLDVLFQPKRVRDDGWAKTGRHVATVCRPGVQEESVLRAVTVAHGTL